MMTTHGVPKSELSIASDESVIVSMVHSNPFLWILLVRGDPSHD